MKLKICLLAMLCLFLQANGQTTTKVTGLMIGDEMPDIALPRVLNYPGGSAKTSDFKNKVLILDFWATWCSSCIAHFPVNYSIQQKHPADVQFLLVSQRKNKDTEAGIIEFFKKRKKEFVFPCVIQDTVLDKLFPHGSIPHYVIIKNNRVYAITNSESITEANIARIIIESGFSLFVKKDLKYNRSKPLFEDGNGGVPPTNMYKSMATGYQLPILSGGIGYRTDNADKIVGIYVINQLLPAIYMTVYPEFGSFPYSRVLFHIPKPERLPKDSIGQTNFMKKIFSYESQFPAVSKNEALRYFKSDLDRYFNLRVDSVIRDTLCLVMRLNSSTPPASVKPGINRDDNIFSGSSVPKYFHNYSVEDIRSELEVLLHAPVLDETRYSSRISLELPADLSDIKALTASLKKQGIIVTREKRKISYLLFSQKHDHGQ